MGPSVEFKGSRSGLLLRVAIGEDRDSFKRLLDAKLAQSAGFFCGSAVRLQIMDPESTVEEIGEIAEMLVAHGLKLGSIVTSGTPQPALEDSGADLGPAALSGMAVAGQGPAVIVRRTLRSGHRVDSPVSAVIVGDVNPGAEVAAAGDIVIMGTLRGVAHAGASGDRSAVVVAFRLNPTQLRIADMIGRSPDSLGAVPTVPEVARIKDGQIVIEAYAPSLSGR